MKEKCESRNLSYSLRQTRIGVYGWELTRVYFLGLERTRIDD